MQMYGYCIGVLESLGFTKILVAIALGYG
jgi:hypothetical protein